MASDNANETQESLHVAYLGRCEFEEGKAFRGGILLVDGRGTPLEFRCTSPIRPNPVQRMLYGDSLEPYMLAELMAKPLLQNVSQSYDIVLVDDVLFLNMRQRCECPVLFVRRQGVTVSGVGAQDAQAISGSLIDSPSGRFDPVVVQPSSEHPQDRDSALPRLERLFAVFDVLEPFERVQRALEKVHEQKALDQT